MLATWFPYSLAKYPTLWLKIEDFVSQSPVTRLSRGDQTKQKTGIDVILSLSQWLESDHIPLTPCTKP